MEFDVNISTEKCGKITITDYAIDYNQYIDEDVEDISEFDKYKFSQSVTINCILKVTPSSATILDVLQNTHESFEDQSTFNVKDDGYYVIEHFVIPNKNWYNTVASDYNEVNEYSTIYIADQGKIFKQLNGELKECTVKEILERNPEGTTLMKCTAKMFYTGNLKECYISYCKKVFDGLMSKCSTKNDDDVWTRDFLLMTLNIIDYLIGFNSYMEASRILSEITRCGGFCSGGKSINKISGCGCSKT